MCAHRTFCFCHLNRCSSAQLSRRASMPPHCCCNTQRPHVWQKKKHTLALKSQLEVCYSAIASQHLALRWALCAAHASRCDDLIHWSRSVSIAYGCCSFRATTYRVTITTSIYLYISACVCACAIWLTAWSADWLTGRRQRVGRSTGRCALLGSSHGCSLVLLLQRFGCWLALVHILIAKKRLLFGVRM